MARLQCIGDWYFSEMKVAGKFPPMTRTRKINAFGESVSTVASKYGVRPHIRVIVVNQETNEMFKMGIVLSYTQLYFTNKIDFSDVVLSAGVDGKMSVRTKLTLIDATFDHLHRHHAEFIRKLSRFCYSDLRKIVARQVTQ